MRGKTIDEINVGDQAEFAKTISEADVYLYAGLSGDYNPAYINEEYAKDTFFKTRIAHGMISAGFISAIIGTKLPGPGTIYLDQSLKFLAPVRIGDTVTAKVKIIKKFPENNRALLETICVNQDEVTVLKGEAMVSPPK